MESDRDISEYNGSQLKMFRIDEILKGIIECRHRLDVTNWLYYLQDFDMELESVKRKEEKEELDIDLKELAEEINQFQTVKNNPRIRHKTTPTEIIDKLNKFQKKLLTIFKTSGLEMKLQEGSLGGFGK